MSAPFGTEDLAGYFAGAWSLQREITGEAGERLGAFTGRATFTERPGPELEYFEEGVLELGAHRGPAHRRLHYRLTGPGRAEVFFDYGEFFHDLDLRAGRWEVTHPCRADVYRGEFELTGPDSFRQRWRVSGPAKAHVLTSSFERLPRG